MCRRSTSGSRSSATSSQLGWLSTPFSIVIVLTAINAFNMFDGSDGVAGTQALIASCSWA